MQEEQLDAYDRLFGTSVPAVLPETTEWWKRQQRDLFAAADDAEAAACTRAGAGGSTASGLAAAHHGQLSTTACPRSARVLADVRLRRAPTAGVAGRVALSTSCGARMLCASSLSMLPTDVASRTSSWLLPCLSQSNFSHLIHPTADGCPPFPTQTGTLSPQGELLITTTP